MNSDPRPLRGGGHVLLGDPPALRTPDGRFLRLHHVPDSGHRALRRYLARVSGVVEERRRTAAAQRWPEGRRRIAVLGRDRLTRLLAAELRRSGAQVRDAADGADLVLDVRDRSADARLDAWLDGLPRHGVAVLRGHRDGEHLHLLPLAVDGSEPTAAQVRRRRLAAAPAAPELAAWLAAPVRTRPLRAPVRAVAVAHCLRVLADWAADAPEVVEHRRTLRVVGPDLLVRTHTVLGFDEPAPREPR